MNYDTLYMQYPNLEQCLMLFDKYLTYLTLFMPNVIHLTEENKIVICIASILGNSVNPLLKTINAIPCKCDEYFKKYNFESLGLKEVKQKFANIKRRFDNTKSNFKCFFDFFEWWICYVEKHGNTCKYCGVSEAHCCQYFQKHSEFTRDGKRGFHLEIDRINSQEGYNSDNCVLACYVCNNAKSNICNTDDEFNPIAEGIKIFWRNM